MARSAVTSTVVLLVLAAASAVGIRILSDGAVERPAEDESCLEWGECDFDGALAPTVDEAPAELGPEACRDAGYLCSGLQARGEDRIMRWADGTSELRVRVLRPEFEDVGRARAYQSAAVNGILTWSGNPFPIRILRNGTGEADIEVEWSPSLGGSQLGRTSTEWRGGPNGAGMRVLGLHLATRRPADPERRLEVTQVGLTAAHEMGHALGLPHSGNRRDVMYPTNSATRLTVTDFESMRGLYALPNGARIDFGGG